MKNFLNKIKSVKLCLMAHPDNQEHSEFADRISDLEEIENEISRDKWIKLNSEDDLPKTDKTIDLWFLTKTGHITINNWNSKFKHKTYGYLKVYSHFQIVVQPDLPLT